MGVTESQTLSISCAMQTEIMRMFMRGRLSLGILFMRDAEKEAVSKTHFFDLGHEEAHQSFQCYESDGKHNKNNDFGQLGCLQV